MGQCPFCGSAPREPKDHGSAKKEQPQEKTKQQPKQQPKQQTKAKPKETKGKSEEETVADLIQALKQYDKFPGKDFDFKEKLGEGSFGHVFRVIRKSDNQEMACKIIDYSKFGKKALQNIGEEVKALKKLKHKYINEFYGAYHCDPQRIYFLMEICRGGELYDRMVKDNKVIKLTENIVSGYVKQILEVLEYIHSLGIVHCDLKPENCIFVSPNSHELRVFDFGFAQQRRSHMTFAKLQGTPMYIAPEALKKEYTENFDMWSVGIMTFEMLHGYAPFQANNPMRIIKKAAKGFNPIEKPRRGPHFNSKLRISPNAKSFITSLLKLVPSQRLTAGEALQHPWINDEDHFPLDSAVVSQLDKFSRLHDIQKIMLPFMLEEARKMNKFLLDKLAKTFEQFDTDGSGDIDFDEFCTLLKEIEEQKKTEQEYLTTFKSIDTDASGRIDKDEFLQWYAWEYVSKQDERFWDLIQSFDNDGDGFITLDEIIMKLESSEQTRKYVDSPMMQGFRKLFETEEKVDIKELAEIIKQADKFEEDDHHPEKSMKVALNSIRGLEPSTSEHSE